MTTISDKLASIPHVTKEQSSVCAWPPVAATDAFKQPRTSSHSPAVPVRP